MAKNPNITFHGKEMYSRLVRNDHNRAVTSADYKNNEYFSPLSVRKGEKRVKELLESIQANGWLNFPVHAYQKDDGRYVLLEGNTRRETLDRAVELKVLDDYPEWSIIDMSVMINPTTGQFYTFEEAERFIEFNDIHSPKVHTATDVIERHAGMGNELCRAICGIAKDFSMSVTTVAEMVTGLRGSSKESNISRVVEMPLNEELAADARKVCEMLNTMDYNRTEETKKSFKEPHCAYAFANVYRLCKRYGVENDFLTFMKAVSTVRRPNPFLHFFDIRRENSYTDQILYMIDGSFETSNNAVAPSLRNIVSALEKGGVMPAISKFHYAFRAGKPSVLSNLYKNVV